ncbi:nidogen-like domain-containing protein [Salinimicrobium sp. WS361]|uniref:nidogen-like domain-containing protein n=1 Tax=Salinimicrobium sp. WS361 TaxID=3425123 RepID=UPI003D6F88E4
MIVIWDQVAHYGPSEKTNTFQVIISYGESELTPEGRNTAFCSKDMQWTTGGASDDHLQSNNHKSDCKIHSL